MGTSPNPQRDPGRAAQTIRKTGFAAIDFESAGTAPGSTDAPVQIGIAIMENLTVCDDLAFHSYIASPHPIRWSAQNVHGITEKALRGAPEMMALWSEIRSRLAGRWVVAHGAPTEKRFLRAFPFHGFGPWVDTLKLARAIAPELASHTLENVAAHFGVAQWLTASHPSFRWHDARWDALASLEVLRVIIHNFHLADKPPALLLHADDSPFHRRKGKGAA